MIVVADTSPINYLILIKEIEILRSMYGSVVIPRAVRENFCALLRQKWFGPGLLNYRHGSKFVVL